MTGAEILVRSLLAQDVDTIFGVPGDTSMAFYDALYELQGKLTHIMARDERSAGFMADAYARVKGKPGVTEGPSGAGATYLLPAVAEAHHSSIPLVAINSDVRISSDNTSALTELDQVALFRPVTKWNTRIIDPVRISDMVTRAFREATSGRPGAVHLAVPESILAEKAPSQKIPSETRDLPSRRFRPGADEVEAAAKLLTSALRPTILAGGGVLSSGAWVELQELAQALDAPVVTSINGKGSISDDSPLSLGVIGGNGGKLSSNLALRESDLILAVGTRLNSVTTDGGRLLDPEARIIWLDIDPAQPGFTFPEAMPLVGDAKLALADLLLAVKDRLPHPPQRQWTGECRERVLLDIRETLEKSRDCRGLPFSPAHVVDTLAGLLPPDAILVNDAGTPTPYVSAYYPVRQPGRRTIFPRAHGGLGYALPAALGARLAAPETPVVSLFGDGSLVMALGELETAARLGQPLVFINLRNDCFGWIKVLQHLYFQERYFSVDFSPSDFQLAAQGLGIRHVRKVSDPTQLQDSLSWALEQEEPVFLDIPVCSPEVEVPPVCRWQEDSQVPPEKRLRGSY